MRFKSFALALFLLLMTTALVAQSSIQSPMQTPIQTPRLGSIPPLNPDDRDNEQRAKLEKELAKKANRDRQAQLQRDTDNLLKLANELKQSRGQIQRKHSVTGSSEKSGRDRKARAQRKREDESE